MELTTEQLKEKINNGEKIIVDFWAPWCGPCKVMKPYFEKAAEVLTEESVPVNLYTFNIENDKDFVVNEMGIRSVPTLKGFNGADILERGVMRTEQIIQLAKTL